MTQRGKKSRVTIAGHNLTWAELSVLRQLQEYLQTSSGGAISLYGIFPGKDPFASGKRHCARGLASRGVLEACQIEFENDIVKGKPQ